jgi:hypothetical protein
VGARAPSANAAIYIGVSYIRLASSPRKSFLCLCTSSINHHNLDEAQLLNHSASNILPPHMPLTTSDPELKAFLEAFYGASDVGPAADPNAHADYASYYAPDANLIMGAKHFAGKEGVLDFRRGGWAEVASRHHVVEGVFRNDDANDVIMLHGTVRYGLKTGQQSEMSWAARMQLVRDGSRGFLIKHYQVWLVRH